VVCPGDREFQAIGPLLIVLREAKDSRIVQRQHRDIRCDPDYEPAEPKRHGPRRSWVPVPYLVFGNELFDNGNSLKQQLSVLRHLQRMEAGGG
jgi:hypothetical protein